MIMPYQSSIFARFLHKKNIIDNFWAFRNITKMAVNATFYSQAVVKASSLFREPIRVFYEEFFYFWYALKYQGFDKNL